MHYGCVCEIFESIPTSLVAASSSCLDALSVTKGAHHAFTVQKWRGKAKKNSGFDLLKKRAVYDRYHVSNSYKRL